MHSTKIKEGDDRVSYFSGNLYGIPFSLFGSQSYVSAINPL